MDITILKPFPEGLHTNQILIFPYQNNPTIIKVINALVWWDNFGIGMHYIYGALLEPKKSHLNTASLEYMIEYYTNKHNARLCVLNPDIRTTPIKDKNNTVWIPIYSNLVWLDQFTECQGKNYSNYTGDYLGMPINIDDTKYTLEYLPILIKINILWRRQEYYKTYIAIKPETIQDLTS